jgi:Flp pilus assembly protein TadG
MVIGGGVDMSRIYLARTSLQAACDAGSLMGRKSMATGAWSDNSYRARTHANEMFDANFSNGIYGTKNLVRSFSEEGVGNIQGTASADVPMSLMKILGNKVRTVTVTCQSEQRIPNTDVMFVLDTTGSMGSPIPNSGSSQSKIDGLKIAVKCFYEALAKENIDDVTPAQCGETVNPSSANSADVQLRFGFVPYAVNVNVGKLLPLDFMADTWTYQSRKANFNANAGYTGTYGTPSNPTVTGTTNSNNSNTSSWEDADDNYVVGNITYYKSFNMNSNKDSCTSYPNTSPPALSTTSYGTPQFFSQTPANPVYPQASVVATYKTTDTTSQTEYRYTKNKKKCTLEVRSGASTSTVKTTQATVPITWVSNIQFVDWTYKAVEFDISALKNESAGAWNNSLSLPIGTNGANTSVAWAGCIEERKTVQLTDSDPTDDWDPIPAEALDMNIDLVPDASDEDTLWGPLLPNAVWLREDSSGNKTLLDRKTNTTQDSAGGSATNCPVAARFYQGWSPSAFKTYVNSFTPGGNTYHDIGLLWGARLMSPTGIFASQTNPGDMTIQRHMVFMTDGDTQTSQTNYSPYGVHWYDRRQTDPASAPSTTLLTANVNARTAALCEAIKNKNITLWVVSYGGGLYQSTTYMLSECASDGHFNSTAQLAATFKGIASEISNLRLTD